MESRVRQRALDVLADIPRWRLGGDAWDRVGQGLRDMERAVGAGDRVALQRAAAEVELAGPYRVLGLEDVDLLPPPETLRERVAELVHALRTPAPPPAGKDPDAAG